VGELTASALCSRVKRGDPQPLLNIVHRVWDAIRPVMSLSKGHEHEIAQAYEVLGEDEDHTGLLSGSWRALKEAG
jgi:hypothetical protein